MHAWQLRQLQARQLVLLVMCATLLLAACAAGVDPTDSLRKLAAEQGMAGRFFSVALGQGQAAVATRMIEDGVRSGHWVFLANCHLMTSWLPQLDKIVEGLEGGNPHRDFRWGLAWEAASLRLCLPGVADFLGLQAACSGGRRAWLTLASLRRLWLSSSPSPAFPIAILQRGIKMTTEPPKGLRANLLRLYNTVSEEGYARCRAQAKYQKLLFALSYFHSILLERRKFRWGRHRDWLAGCLAPGMCCPGLLGTCARTVAKPVRLWLAHCRTLGLNIPYDFNDTDFSVSDDLLQSYLDSYVDTPWAALKYLIAEANYGGRVTDELDRRVLASYLNRFYCEEVGVPGQRQRSRRAAPCRLRSTRQPCRG
jgi:dynein heavy chain